MHTDDLGVLLASCRQQYRAATIAKTLKPKLLKQEQQKPRHGCGTVASPWFWSVPLTFLRRGSILLEGCPCYHIHLHHASDCRRPRCVSAHSSARATTSVWRGLFSEPRNSFIWASRVSPPYHTNTYDNHAKNAVSACACEGWDGVPCQPSCGSYASSWQRSPLGSDTAAHSRPLSILRGSSSILGRRRCQRQR